MTSMREKMARGLCARYKINPDTLAVFDDEHGVALGNTNGMLERPLWMNQLRNVDAVLDVLTEPTPQVLAAIDTELHPSWLGHRAYELMIQAIKDGK